MQFAIIFYFFTLTSALKTCETIYRFQAICNYFLFNEKDCFPYDTLKCEVFRTSYDEFFCPTYICTVSKIYK